MVLQLVVVTRSSRGPVDCCRAGLVRETMTGFGLDSIAAHIQSQPAQKNYVRSQFGIVCFDCTVLHLSNAIPLTKSKHKHNVETISRCDVTITCILTRPQMVQKALRVLTSDHQQGVCAGWIAAVDTQKSSPASCCLDFEAAFNEESAWKDSSAHGKLNSISNPGHVLYQASHRLPRFAPGVRRPVHDP